jgi:transcriptional antiterminator NusG
MIDEYGLSEHITEVIVPTEDVIEVKDGKIKATVKSVEEIN